jgi:hypothetical protein
MSTEVTEVRRGLKPGQRHSGQFQKGHDPRRFAEAMRFEGKTIAQLARAKGPDAIETLAKIMLDRSVSPAARIQAATALLDRGYGKAVSIVDMNVTHDRPASAMTRTEIMQLLTELRDQVIEGECSEVTDTVPSTVISPDEDVT